MGEFDRQFEQGKNLADPVVRGALIAKGPMRQLADPDTTGTIGVFDAGNGQTFTERADPSASDLETGDPLSVTMKPQIIVDEEQARVSAVERDLDPATVIRDEKGRFLARDASGDEFFIGRSPRPGEFEAELGDSVGKAEVGPEGVAPGEVSAEPGFEEQTPQQRARAAAAGEGRQGELPTEPPDISAGVEAIADIGEGVAEFAGGVERGLERLVLEAINTAVEGVEAIGLEMDDREAVVGLLRKALDRRAEDTGIPGVAGEVTGQFILPLPAVGAGLAKLGITGIKAVMLGEGLIEALGQNPDDPNLGNLIPEDTQNAFVDFIGEITAADPDGSQIAERAKKFAQGAGLGGIADQLIKLGKRAFAIAAAQIPAAVPALAEDEEEIQVAQLGPIMRGVARRAAPIVERRGPTVRLRPATEIEGREFLDDMGLQSSKVGADFNFENMTDGESVKQAINEMSEVIGKQIDEEKRGVITREATRDMAEQLDILPDVLTRKQGELFNAEQIVAARIAMADSATRLDGLANKAASADATERDLLEFRRQMALHATIQMQVKGAQTEIARALSSFNIPVGAGGQIPGEKVTELLDEFGGTRTAKWMAERYLQLGDQVAKNKVAFGGAWARAQSVFFEVWINGLLSGPFTHVRNTVGNTLFQAWAIPEYMIAAGIGAARSTVSVASDRVFLGEIAARSFGTIQGFKDALALASKAFRTASPQDPISKVEAAGQRTISAETFGLTGSTGKAIDLIGNIIRLPGRFLMAEDEFFKGIAGRMELNQLAYRAAKQAQLDGATRAEAENIAITIMRDPPEGIQKSVEDAQRYYTFTDENIGFVADAVKTFQRVPMVGRLILPFRRTPMNIMKRFGERSPFAVMMPSVWRNIQAGGAQRDMAVARIALGSGLMSVAASYAADGILSGGGPRDPKQRRQLRQTGWQPWSIKVQKGEGWIDDTTLGILKGIGAVSESKDSIYISYLGIEPVGNFLAIASDTMNALKWSDDFSKNEDLAAIAVAAVTESMTDRSFFRGISDLSSALQFGPGAFNRYISNVARSMKPFSSLINTINRTMDPTLRDVRADPDAPFGVSQYYAFLNGWKRNVPGLSDTLPQIRNIWGNPIKLGEGNWFELVNPFYISTRKYAPVDVELVRLGVPFSLPQAVISGVKLDAKQHARLVELQGKEVEIAGVPQKEALSKMINSSMYLRGNDEDKTRLVRNIHQDYLDEAVKRLSGLTQFRGRKRVNIALSEDLGLALKIQGALEQDTDELGKVLPKF